jgi:hypothetical protein
MPLTYRDRGASGTQLDIVSGNDVIGNLWKNVLSVTAGQAVHWSWTFHKRLRVSHGRPKRRDRRVLSAGRRTRPLGRLHASQGEVASAPANARSIQMF